MSIILFKQKHNECFLYIMIEYDVCHLRPVRWIKVCQVRWTLKSVFGQVLKALNYMLKVNTSLHPTHQREDVTTEYLCEETCRISRLKVLLDFFFFFFKLNIKNFRSNKSRIGILGNSLITLFPSKRYNWYYLLLIASNINICLNFVYLRLSL